MTDFASFLGERTFVIFLFHGVIHANTHPVRNYNKKHLPLDEFTAILESLCRSGAAVSMPQIVSASLGADPLPPRAFAVTFDDGFENVYSVAAPVLRRLGLPATFYFTTKFVDENAPSWVDMIDYAVEITSSFRLSLPFVAGPRVYDTPRKKRELLESIRGFVKSNPAIDPYEFAEEVWRQLDVKVMKPDPELDQKLSWEKVRALADDDLFTIGGHSHTHRILEYLSQAELGEEIATSLNKLRSNINKPIKHYSYPEGLANCYSDRVIAALKSHGIVCSPTAEHGVNRLGDDLFRLKRIAVT